MTTPPRSRVMGSWIARWAGYFAFWVILIGFKPADLVVGVGAAIAATWASMALLPPGDLRLRLAGVPRYGLHFLWQSIVAGIDIARRAFARDMRLSPGLVTYHCRYPGGAACNAFASLTSLLPGTLAVYNEQQALVYHCLNTGQPVPEQLAEEEGALCGVLPPGSTT